MRNALSQTTKEIIFGATDIYFAGARALFDTFYVFFASQMLDMPLHQAGLIYSIALIVRALSEPAAGMVSDHIQTRWGKRKPFFAIGAPFVFLTFMGVWYPYELSQASVFYIGLTSAIAYGFVSGCMMTPYAAMAPDIVEDYHGRTRLSNIRHLFQLIILSIAIVVFSRYFSEENYVDHWSYLIVVILFGLLFSLPFLLLSIFIQEKPSTEPREHWHVLFKRLLLPFKDKNYNIYLVMNGAIDTVLIILPALFPFYLEFYLDSFDLLPYYAVSLGLGAFLAVFILMRFGKTWCKITIFKIAVALAIGMMIIMWLLPRDYTHVANIIFFFLGFVVAGTSTARLSMLTDLADVVSKRFHTSCQATVFAEAKATAQTFAALVMLIIFQTTALRNQGGDVPVDGLLVKHLLVYPSIALLAVALIAAFVYTLDEKFLNHNHQADS